MMVAFLGLAVSSDYAQMVLFLGLAGLGFGLMRPSLMAAMSLSAGRRHQGAVAGLLNSTAAMGHVINPFTGAVLYGYWHAAPFYITSFLMGVFFMICWLHPKIRAFRKKNLDEKTEFDDGILKPPS